MRPNTSLALSLTAALLAIPAAGQAKTYTVTCYLQGPSGDADYDGYAAPGSPSVTLTVEREDRLSCPDGYVRRDDDCDDTDASIHPRRAEIGRNGIDDNCNGQVDETEPIYYANGNANTTSSFTLRARVNDSNIIQHASNLYVQVVLNPLDSSTVVTARPRTKVYGLSAANPYVNVVVGNLAPNRVFRAKLRFYRLLQLAPPGELEKTSSVGGSAYAVKTGTASTTYTLAKSFFIKVGEDSLWYYTTTDGTSSWSQMRTAILLKALREVEESRLGKVGYWGTSAENGTRYGGNMGDKWCSEFYVWGVDDYLTLPWDTSDELKYAFSKKGAYYTDVEGEARRADWLHMSGHSAMFLALDTAVLPRIIWSVDGNVGGHGNNEVMVVQRQVTEYLGVGHLQQSMWYPW
jgi:hypothetical protein